MTSLIKSADVEKQYGDKNKERCRECMYGRNEGGWWREIMTTCTWDHCPMFERNDIQSEE